MIESVTIKNLRGIREGTLANLRPLVVLVGPNSSGKSTILDALLIGGNRRPSVNVGRVVRRRPGLQHGARWLFWRGGLEQPARIEITFSGAKSRSSEFRWSQDVLAEDLRKQLVSAGSGGPFSEIDIEVTEVTGEDTKSIAVLSAENRFAASERDESVSSGFQYVVWMVDPRYGPPLHDLYSRVAERGQRQAVLDLISAVVPGLILIEISTDYGDPRLTLTFADGAVPAALAGDGIQALVRLCLELASRSDGTVLLEEPEAHQHPAAVRQSARAIVEGVRRGVQVILSTHSLELIDALLGEMRDEELDLLSLYRLKLEQGLMLHSRLDGIEVLHSRGEIEDDLR